VGQEIVYCFKCSSRIVGADSGKGVAYSIGDRVACAACASAMLTHLPPQEREDLLARMLKETKSKTRAVSKRTPSRGTEIIPPPPQAPPSKTPVIAAVVGIAVLVMVLVVAMSGNSPPKVPDPAPTPPQPRVERTAPEPPKPRENFDAELARIDDSIAGVSRQEGYKEALEYLASARKRHDAPEWTLPIDRRLGKTNDEIQALYASLENKALEARRRGSEVEVKEICDRVGRWSLPERSTALRKSIDAVAPGIFKQGADGIVCIEAEHFSDRKDESGHSWTFVKQPPGFEGDGAMQGLPNDGTLFTTDYAAKSPRLDFRIEFVKSGPHYVWVRAAADADSDNSFHCGLDGEPVKTLGQMAYPATKKWVWTNKQNDGKNATFTVAAPGVHTFSFWVREDGAFIDRFILTTDPKWGPKGNGPPQSPR